MFLLSSEITELHLLLKEAQHHDWYIVIGIIICFVIGIYCFKYFGSKAIEKAKSDVTQKNIEEITLKVESVKKDFTTEIEHLRTDLLFKNTIKGIIYTDRKEAVIKYYEAFQIWHTTIENHLISCMGYRKEQLLEAEKEIEKYEFGVSLTETKAELYVFDEKYFELSDKYYYAIAEIEKLVLHLMIFLSNERNIFYSSPKDRDAADIRITERFNSDFEKSKTISASINNTWFDFRDACFKIIANPSK